MIISLFVMARTQSAAAILMARNFYGVLRVTDEVAPNVVMLNGEKQRTVDEDSRFRRLTNEPSVMGCSFFRPPGEISPRLITVPTPESV